MLTISIDRGGTFTDVIAENAGRTIAFKLLSVDPHNYPDAPTEGIRRVLEIVRNTTIAKGIKLDLSDVDVIRMGTTVATNALLERKGERVVLLTTKGFGSLLEIGQQARPDIFDLKVRKMDLLYEEVIEVDERVLLVDGHVSVEREPDLDVVRRHLQRALDNGITSVAIALMHSYLFPEHELAIAKVAAEMKFQNVSVSSQLQPMVKLVSRANSACADAYLSPIIHKYLQNIAEGFVGGIETLDSKLFFMQSDGGLTSAKDFSGMRAILSGPAGGVVGYAFTSYDHTDPKAQPVLGFDMGGTSTDVSRYSGKLDHVFETTVAQVTIQSPQLAIDTVAAGGGSVLSFRNGLFTVGPESASAHPGPACYRKKGPLTVTDANLLLGRIDVETFPHIFGPDENLGLDVEIVKIKFQELADQIAIETGSLMSIERVASGFLDVANETMCRPIRGLTEGKGFNCADHKLACFGGAGGQHAASVAKALGINEVVIHKYSSLLSAYGIALADVVKDVTRPMSLVLPPENDTTDLKTCDDLTKTLDELEKQALTMLTQQNNKEQGDVIVERYLNCRYDGSNYNMMIHSSPSTSAHENAYANYRREFVARHEREFGFKSERDVIVTSARVRVVHSSRHSSPESLIPNKIDQFSPATGVMYRTQPMYFDGWKNCKLFNVADLSPGVFVEGPAMILDDTQTIVVEPEVSAFVHQNHIVLKFDGSDKLTSKNSAKYDETVDPILLSVFGHRFMSIAEQMGHLLQKTAISVNIKERLDFSCAVFDPEGGLVANAPHIPVHLGSMSSQVKWQMEIWKNDLKEGDVLVANHPEYGGSHLPDITVITPVFNPGTNDIIFWVASRGHHSDIGGISAGSMPPFSHYLWEEGACIRGFKLVKEHELDLEGIKQLLYDEPAKYPGCSGSRSLNDSIADLKAQIAANNKGIQLIHALAAEYSLKVVQKYMKAIQDNAENAVRNMLKRVALSNKHQLTATDYLDDGSPIVLKVDIDSSTGSAKFDFTGTGSQIYGNLNSPAAITHSAILYCLRSMISEAIPLNQGCLTPLQIIIPKNSLLSPGPNAATVGGNVETSQRVCDVILHAFKSVAGSQGTCNNLTFGCEDFGYYETIGGGAGAGHGFNGQSGVQVHMTNTRSTDPEVLENRYPVILRQFQLRLNSGGRGHFTGGDGVIREFEFKKPMQVSILSERRSRAPYGLCGGEPGKPGVNYWIPKGQATRSLGGKNTFQVHAEDRVIIETPGGGGYGPLP